MTTQVIDFTVISAVDFLPVAPFDERGRQSARAKAARAFALDKPRSDARTA
jgi:hypothetical protein